MGFHAGDPGSNAPGLSESLETLGKSPGLCEPVIPGAMGFMSVALRVHSLIPGTFGGGW